MNYYFIYDNTPLDIISAYTRLTGTPELPPLWALGYHPSKWSYYPDKAVYNLVERFRGLGIPCDAVHLDHHCLLYTSFQRACRSYDDNGRRIQSGLAAFDIQEFLCTQVKRESGLRDGIVPKMCST